MIWKILFSLSLVTITVKNRRMEEEKKILVLYLYFKFRFLVINNNSGKNIFNFLVQAIIWYVCVVRITFEYFQYEFSICVF